jgi:ribonuclease HI
MPDELNDDAIGADIAGEENAVVIYSDGGADPNPGIGGWAALLRYGDHEKILKGAEPKTTNNRMELRAAIEAFRALKRPCKVEFHTDSQYVRRGITEGVPEWAEADWLTKSGRPVPNADLWQELLALVQRHTIDWRWVRGHRGDPSNELVDALAREARLAITPKIDLATNVPRLYLRAACKGNPGPGSWAVALESDGEWEMHSGAAGSTTNNRMEITAAIEGLKLLPPGSSVQLLTTSDYLFQGATRWAAGWRAQGWRKKDGQLVANADLWRELTELEINYQVEWVNVKGQRLEGLERAGNALQQAR